MGRNGAEQWRTFGLRYTAIAIAISSNNSSLPWAAIKPSPMGPPSALANGKLICGNRASGAMQLKSSLLVRSVSYTLSGLRTGGGTAGAAGTAITAPSASRASR